MIGLLIFAIALFVILEGFFSGSELALCSLNRVRLQSRVESGWPGAKLVQRLLDRQDTTIMTTLIGTNLMVYASSALCTNLYDSAGFSRPQVLTTLTMTPIIFLFGEMLPKDICYRNADFISYRVAKFLYGVKIIFMPLIMILEVIVHFFTRRAPAEQRSVALSRSALREWVAEGTREGVISPYQNILFANVMELFRRQIDSTMIPLNKAIMVRTDSSGEILRLMILTGGKSRLPVFDQKTKRVVGILNSLDLIFSKSPDVTAGELARPSVIVKASDSVTSGLLTLQKARQHMAIVEDNEGKTVGIVTIKDLVEEVFGELQEF